MLDFRTALLCREAPLELELDVDFCEEDVRDSVVDDCGFSTGFPDPFTVTIFVVIFGGAFFALSAANDKGRLLDGDMGPMLENDDESS